LAIPPLLTATPSGDVLELRPGGSWTAANVTTLEALSDAVMPALDRSKTVKMDMAEVRELDTLGAWLLEKMSRRATSASHRAEVVGVADNYAGLIEEVRQVNRHNPAPVPALNPGFIYWLHNTGGLGPRATYHVQFEGSVPGLLVGAAVLFNGIRVGEVTDLGLAPDNPRRVDATISVTSTTPVRADTKVGLEFQGLTGVSP
jgi:ABC-type transporter Mla MlaB component